MRPVRSLLWIGSGDHFEGGLAADAPALDVVWAADVDAALALPLGGFDAAVLDCEQADEACEALRRLGRRREAPPLLVRVRTGALHCIPELLAAGAGDVVVATDGDASVDKSAELLARIKRLTRGARTPPQAGASGGMRNPPDRYPEIVGASRAMAQVFDLLDRARRSQATVLISGETGTGKELLARAIHDGSPRHERPWVALNCAAFPDTLLESELFGHAKGAFTGADRDKKGLFEVADKGTLFLDELGDTSGPFQAKLLRALQEREIRPVGSVRPRRVDVRVLAASNRDLWSETCAGRFREDLYYRLAVFPIRMPPLRERPEDIPPLATHFLEVHGRREEKSDCRLSSDALDLLLAYSWPGNVRELENELQRALAMVDAGDTIAPRDLSPRIFGIVEPVAANAQPGEPLRVTLQRIEAWLIRRALQANDGRRATTARRLGITREGLYKKMQRLGIE